jgi:hypothetical protein
VIVNLTPHPIHIYGPATPDRIEPDGEYEPILTVEPSGQIARLGGEGVASWAIEHDDTSLPIDCINYGEVIGLPAFNAQEWDGSDDAPRTYYVVSLVVALGKRARPDLLSPYREVRTMQGSVLGCRALARPV